MTATDLNWLDLCDEHGKVVRALGRAQRRASAVIVEQARRIAQLEAQAMQLRAAVVIRESALAWSREELAEVKTAMVGLPKRLALVQQVRMLEDRVQTLMRGASAVAGVPSPSAVSVSEPDAAAPGSARARVVMWISPQRQETRRAELALAGTGVRLVRTDAADPEQLKAGFADADLVICQAGCVSHGDWWRVKDYCSRTGKQCVLVQQPDALERVIAARPLTPIDAAD